MSPGTPQSPNDEISFSLHSNLSLDLRQQLRGSFGASTMDSDLQHIFEVLQRKENDLAEDIRGHKTEIQKHQMEISKHQMEVGKHQATLIDLENKQKGLEMCSGACRTLLAPIRRLPVEMLKEIFTHFCDQIVISDKTLDIPPLKLTAICGAWRDLVFSTPQLWTQIEVNTSRRQSLHRLRHMELLTNLVLEHSRNAPLHLLVGENYLRPDYQSARHDVVVSIMKSIARHSHRWCHITLELPSALLHEMNPFIKTLPLLESLTAWGYVTPFDMVNIAPKLRHVELQDINKLTDFKLPWHQILTLRIPSFDTLTSEVVACLRLCTSLQRLDLSCSCYPEEDFQAGGAHTIPKLESLFLEILGPSLSDLGQLFDLLTLPQLTTLSISIADSDFWEWDGTFGPVAENFFMRSSCTITSLALRDTPLTDDELISLLRLLPSIEELSISQCYDLKADETEGSPSPLLHNTTDSLITSLHVLHSGSFSSAQCQPLLPNLLEIDLAMNREHAPSCEALVTLVKSRWLPDPTYAADIGVVCLKSVTFHFWDGPVDYDFSPLACLRDAGLNFTTSGTKC